MAIASIVLRRPTARPRVVLCKSKPRSVSTNSRISFECAMPRDLSTYDPRRCRPPTSSLAQHDPRVHQRRDRRLGVLRSRSVPDVRLVNIAVTFSIFRVIDDAREHRLHVGVGADRPSDWSRDRSRRAMAEAGDDLMHRDEMRLEPEDGTVDRRGTAAGRSSIHGCEVEADGTHVSYELLRRLFDQQVTGSARPGGMPRRGSGQRGSSSRCRRCRRRGSCCRDSSPCHRASRRGSRRPTRRARAAPGAAGPAT